MFDKVLIANRSEIALRIIRTCKRMGISTVAVFSEVDSRSPYVEEADETVFIGAARAQESFLNQKKILAAALSRKCQAIHPGYGFLSENAEFAKLVADAGLNFIGPPPLPVRSPDWGTRCRPSSWRSRRMCRWCRAMQSLWETSNPQSKSPERSAFPFC